MPSQESVRIQRDQRKSLLLQQKQESSPKSIRELMSEPTVPALILARRAQRRLSCPGRVQPEEQVQQEAPSVETRFLMHQKRQHSQKSLLSTQRPHARRRASNESYSKKVGFSIDSTPQAQIPTDHSQPLIPQKSRRLMLQKQESSSLIYLQANSERVSSRISELRHEMKFLQQRQEYDSDLGKKKSPTSVPTCVDVPTTTKSRSSRAKKTRRNKTSSTTA